MARGGSTIAADSSCRACPFCTFVCCVYDKICSSGFCVITLLTVFITARTSAYLGSLSSYATTADTRGARRRHDRRTVVGRGLHPPRHPGLCPGPRGVAVGTLRSCAVSAVGPRGARGLGRVCAGDGCRVCVAICDSACAVIFKRSAYGERARACGRARVRIYHLRCAMGRRIPDVVEN